MTFYNLQSSHNSNDNDDDDDVDHDNDNDNCINCCIDFLMFKCKKREVVFT